MRHLRPWMLALGFACGLAAQQAPGQQAPYIFHASNKGDVLLHVTVLDNKDHNVAGLTKDDFTVLDNGAAQQIQYFAEEDAPVSVGILVDNSGSMKGKQEKVRQAALNFVQSSNPQDEVFIINFNDIVTQASGFTNSIPELEKALTTKALAATAIYDAITMGLQYELAHAKNDKRVLLVITDGYDDASTHSLDETLRLAQSPNGPLIYGIGLLDPTDIPSEHKQGEKILKQFAEVTGGSAYFPADLDQVDTITRDVAGQIRAQYTLIYHSTNLEPGYHTIQLRVSDNGKKYTVHARTGYYAGGNP